MSNAYRRNCNVCGQPIVMAQDPRGYWQPLELDGSGRHEHWSGIGSSGGQGLSSKSVVERGSPFTYPTTCWWCGAPVYFHTNGFGDAVLFDELGWPWKKHPCWEEMRDSHHYQVDSIDIDLLGTHVADGRFLHTERPTARRQTDESLVELFGFVSDNGALYEAPPFLTKRASRLAPSINLVELHIDANDELRYPFLAPLELAQKIDDYALVRARGRWGRGARDQWGGGKKWGLYLLELRVRRYGSRAKRYRAMALDNPVCYFCGASLDLETLRWGLDDVGNLECSICSPWRASLGGKEFLAHCKKVASRHEGP